MTISSISSATRLYQTLQQDMQSLGQRHHHYASFFAQAALVTAAASNAGSVSNDADSVDISV